MRTLILCLSLLATAIPATAQDALGLAAPNAVLESGLLKHILPRFSLKTGIRVRPDDNGAMALGAEAPGAPAFQGDGVIYHLRIDESDPRQVRFRDWLLSDVGKRTIDSFQIDGTAPFSATVTVEAVVIAPSFEGDAARGAELALTLCGRCHVVGEVNRKNGIGSTPSFMVLRSFPDWDIRFQQFYALRPHGAFTQIADVTAPFDPERPSPIAPVELTLDDLDAILAFVAETGPADLGAPLQLQ